MFEDIMARFGTTSRISSLIELTEIKITLDRFAPPTTTLTGRMMTGNRKVDSVSTSEIRTMHLSEAGRAFIDEVKTAFGSTSKNADDDG
jgi:hypothetical protein